MGPRQRPALRLEQIMNKMPVNASGRAKRPGRPPSASVALPAEAARLLTRLAEAGAYARPDPLAEEALLVRRGGDGISVGSGRRPSRETAAQVPGTPRVVRDRNRPEGSARP